MYFWNMSTQDLGNCKLLFVRDAQIYLGYSFVETCMVYAIRVIMKYEYSC